MTPVQKSRLIKVWAASSAGLLVVVVLGWLIAVRVFDRNLSVWSAVLNAFFVVLFSLGIADIDRRKRLPPGDDQRLP